ncbi:MAG TPA: GNAT family protein [Devosiaceae bacterium]|jgi:RimJ/RimL family protein N-acetyltransferase|nr:GNAT family protein [Devosiaceae bacterium]
MPLSLELPITTERLILRPFTRGDVEAVFAYRQREDVARYLLDEPMTRETCTEAVKLRVNQTSFVQQDDRITLAVERRAENDLIGEITMIWRSIADRQAEVGYILNPEFHHRGYATEAVRAFIDKSFAELDLHRIFARCDARNTGSYLLMERLGMRREAYFREYRYFRGAWDDQYVYAVLRREWPTG